MSSSMYRFMKETTSNGSAGGPKRLFVQGGTENSAPSPPPSKTIKVSSTSNSSSYMKTSRSSPVRIAPVSPQFHRRSVTNIITEKSSRSPINQPPPGAPITTTIAVNENQNERYRRTTSSPVPGGVDKSSFQDVANLQAIFTQRHLSTEVLGSSLESTKTSRSGENGARRITTRIVRKVTTLTRGEEKSVSEDLMRQAEAHSISTSQTQNFRAIQPKHVKISDIVVGQEPNVSAREALLRWARRSTAKYPGVRVNDFTSSWRDGLAFNALIHRNRPDLVDWRTTRTRQVRERLEYAFHVVEKEYGVTRLLDPEDVDTHEPDEKSLITYISSLYDVFPEPPPVHPLYDVEAQRRVQEYRQIASELHLWIREKHSQMQDRTFPSTLIEMKKLSSESSRFRNEEVPVRQADKKRLVHLFRDLERYFESIGEVDLEPELHIDQLERNWTRLMAAHQERDIAIHDEMKRLERLQRLAEKVHRELKNTDGRIDDLERQIEEEARRLDRMHPLEAKRTADVLDQELRATERAIEVLFGDVQALRDGRYPQAGDLHKKVTRLHQRWVSLRSLFHKKILQPLSSLSFPVEERTVTRHTRTVLETRLVDTNSHFRHLQECTDWCREKLKQLQAAEYGTDLQSVQQELDHHQREHKQIDQFHNKVEACIKAKQQFHGEELALYNQHLGQLQKVYAELSSVSNNRLSDLESLLDFIKSATSELMWLNQKEEVEVTRDWSDKQLNVQALEQYYESLMNELEKREIQFSAVQDRGEALVLQHHPATKCIEAHMAAMQAQWAWLLQLTLCLETHLKHAAKYQQFFKDIKLAEQWIHERDETMNTEYSVCDFTLDQGERLLQGMQALRDELNTFSDTVQHLSEQATTIVPLKLRRQPVTRPLTVLAACSYKQANVIIEKGAECTLHDNSGRVKWRVTNKSGVEGQVPGVCFVIPPPDKEALEAAERLRRQFDRSIALWQKKQLRMRQNMIFATIKVVKSWDLAQFVAMGADQRNAIRRALNEDADKLLSEGDPADPQLRRLRREMEEVNKLFDDFEKRARAEEESKNASRIFSEQATTLQSALEEAERVLSLRIQAPLPRDLDSLEHLVIEHKEFETRLQKLSSDVEQVQETFRSITLKTPQMKKALERVLDKWNGLWESSSLYIERLKCAEIVINGMEEANNTISEFEHKLVSYKELPSDKESLKIIHEDLLTIQNAVGSQQIAMDQLNDDCDNIKRLTEKSRSVGSHAHRGPHIDLDRIDQEINRLNTRWSNVCAQLVDRLRSIEQAYALLKNYQKTLEAEETWMDETYGKLNNFAPLGERAKEHLEPTRALLTNVRERAPKIENVNGNGGRFIREGKQAVEEKYRLCDETLNKLLSWISQVEDRLASQDVVKEYEEELRNQINTMKQIKEDLDTHNRPVTQCGDQVRQLVLTAGDVLSKDEVTTLEKNGRALKQRYDRACDRTEGLLRRLSSARDELSKFRNDLTVFSDWLDKSRRILEEKERSLSDLGKLHSSADSTREFVSDVIAHKADLRFITMAAQKFVNESKEYLTVLNDFRTSLPSRLPHIKPLSSQDSPVSNDLSIVTQNYRDLLNRANALSDRLSGVGGRQRDYSDAVEKARRWLREIEPKVLKVLSEPIGAEPKIVEEQLNRAKALNHEFLSQGRLIDNAKQSVISLLKSLEGQLSPTEIGQLEQPVIEMEDKYNQLAEALSEKCQELDTALVQSQGVQDALDGLVNWLNQIENQFKALQRPASLNKERLDEQVREQKMLQADLDSHRPSVDSITATALELITNASNARVAKKIETKLNDVKSRFERVLDKSIKRGEFLDEVHQQLATFNVQASHFEQWYIEITDFVDSLAKASTDEYTFKINELSKRRDAKKDELEDTIQKGRNLVGKKDVTDTVPVRDRIKALETQWKDLNSLLDEKQKLFKQRAEHLSAYDKLREQVIDWLTNVENRVSRLEPIAIDLEIVKRQNEELKPIAKEYREYAPTIDKVNDLGNIYDNLLRGERPDSPGRRRSQAYSPTKRSSITPSPFGRSPSPNKPYQLISPVSPSGSSGFSSRRSSQDGFHLDELSPVQQQLAEINNRYSLLGVRINDRQNELDSIRDELKKHLDALKTLANFLEKVQRQMPKDSVPNTKEEADKTNKVYKGIIEDMYEKQSLLDSTKSQVKDLLRRKPNVIGADRLNDELEEVLAVWRNLSEKCKDRIRFMDDIKDFHDTHDGLNAWLVAKDRMLAALGPISSDSRMVQSQVQQVQVLREEFRSQQPQLQHLNDVGDNVLSCLIPNTPDHQKVVNKLQNVQQKWAELLARLEERAESLGAAADTSREFDASLARLRDALQGISDNLDDLPLDKDPEELLRKIENLERQLEGQRPLLADAEANGAQLCEVLSDPASRAEIQAKLAAVGRQYNALQKKLDHRKAEIEGSLRDGRQFEASCAKTLGWLSDELGALTDRLLISADRDVLQQQVDHHEPIYRDVMAREHEVIMLLNKGRDVLARAKTSANTANSEATRSLQRDVDKIQQHWDKLKKETVERHNRLQTCLEHCRKYYKAQDLFLPWLRQAEDKLDSLGPASFKRKHLEQRLRELQQFRNDIWKKSGEYENNRTLGETFLSACDIDKDIVKSELNNVKQRWEKLNNGLIEKIQALEDTSRRLSDFNENLQVLQHGIQRCEDRLQSHDSLGGASKDPKLLERIKQLREEVAGLKIPLQTVRQLAQDLVNEAGEHGVDATHLQDEVDALGDRIEDLQSKLDDRCSELQSAATAVTQFNDKVKNLSHDLSGLENELDNMKPIGRDIKTVRGQQEEVSRFLHKVAQAGDDVADAMRSGELLVDSGFAPDTAQTRQQVETLSRQLQKLDDRGKRREADLQTVIDKLQAFYESHAGVLDDIQDASDQLRKMKPIGSEVEQIRSQQDDFRIFRTHTVEPLSQSVDECNRLGQSLIQSAAGGVNTNSLEKDLEKMNEKWNDLKARMNERERKLDVGLLQSGKFQEALDGLAQWLTDTEEMVANQKSPSADYKVVKAQLQEQKFLKKMLLDRQNSMSSLFTMGNEIAQGADPAERKAIEKQLKDLMGRFDNLTAAAQQRTLALEQAMHVAKRFQDKLVPLQEWLDKTEKKIKDMELVPTDEEKIQQRIREHEVIHDDILCKKPDFSELTEIASQLMELVGEDEALGLADKLQEATDRYTALVDASDNVGQLLTASRQGLRHLVLTYQDLVGWMDAMEDRLGRYRVLAVHTDKLLEQMDDLADLTEEISTRQSAVDGTVDSGLELMKHISSDEALQLKDKLDSLQRRYNDLTSRGIDLLKHAQEALPLVQQFHNSHNRLVDWMLSAEATLQHGEPREDDIARLELDIQELRPVLDAINLIGPKLCQISPGEGAATIEGLVTRDNRRFDAIVEQIQRKAERIHLSKQRSLEVLGDIDELLEWFREIDGQLRDAEKPSAEPNLIRIQLKEHRALNDDISSQKGRVRDVLATAKKVLRESPPNEDTSTIREKMEDLREMMDLVSSLSSDRLSILEQALPLAEHFRDTHLGLSAWLDDMEQQVTMLAMPALRPDLIAQQQDRNEMFLQSINEHKPLVEKLNKTGEALIKLCNDEDSIKVQELLDQDNDRYNALKAELRERQQALEDALQESSQFSDKLEGMLRALGNTADQVKSSDPVSAHVPKIEEQIDENDALVGDLNKREEAYAAVKKAASDVLHKAANRQSDPAIKDIKRKLEKLNNLWQDVQKATNDRGRTLNDALEAAKKFWKELHAVMAMLKDLQDSLSSQEPPAVEPSKIQEQQVALQEIRQEIVQTKPEVEKVKTSGQKLMKLCGEPDKPEVKKHIEDLDSAWDNITALYAKREENLIDAMEKAMEFHETLQNLLSFLAKAEERFAKMGPLGTDIDAVKKQINQLKDFKNDVDPHMVKVEALNRQAQELTERTSVDQAAAIKEPLSAVNKRWDTLLRAMVERQRQLENALLRLGQFQHALNELLVWIEKSDQTLDDLKPILGDPQVLEIELAKLKVLVNDIQAHQTSVDTLNDAGRQIIESGKGTDEASTTQDKLTTLNRRWRDLLQKANDRQRELEAALKEAHLFHAEIQDLLSWLADIDGVIAASKPVGGLPETASEQLERFMELYNELEDNRPKVETVLQQGQEYLKKTQANSAMNLQQNLKTLKQRWDSTTARASDKKIKLEIALKEATEFHDALQAFVDWLTNAEKILSNLKPVSRVMETIMSQIEEHKTFQRDVGVHRETMLNLDKKGTHLKYFSQKQDVILIKNLLISVQHRWERVVAKSAERTRALDHGYKEAREFHDSWLGLMNWLTDTEKSLDELNSESAVNDPEKIKQRIAKHREFQRALSSKQGTYDNTMKLGKQLKEKAPKTDEPTLKHQLTELKNKWTTVCTKSVDRQRKLEEALLFSGQFKDAIQALLEWLQKVEKHLSENGPVHGDLDTVMGLVDQHKSFEQDLQGRAAQMESVTRTGRELEANANTSDASAIRSQVTQLNSLWDRVSTLTTRRSERLEEALKEAEKLHKAVHMLLEWLSDAEMRLRFAGPLPDEEHESRRQMSEHAQFLRELGEKEHEKNSTIDLAQRILAKAHPDAVSVIKHWITIIQSRWEEVSSWAKQREQRLDQHMQGLKDLDDTLEELLAWLQGLENTLSAMEAEALPDEIPELEILINDHHEFMENTSTRQVEVDRVCKARQIKPQTKEAPASSRKLSKPKAGTRGSQHDLQRESSPDLYDTLDRKQSFKGSRDQLATRKGSRASPGRELGPNDGLPHYGPRFPPKGSKEPEFRTPRVKLLWDKWRNVWIMAWERQKRLHDKLMYLQELDKVKNFSWDNWRKRFLKFMNHKKSRLTDLFRKMDKDNNGLIPREDFIDGIIKTKFDTSRLEMNAVADLFDRNNSALIDWKEFIAALRPDWEERKPNTDADKIHDEVKRLVMLCTCRQKFRVFQVGEGKYRFGDSQKLRLVRILRSTVMVRVGGGWVALDEFLVKNDPCRAEEVMLELMPIFERVRQREELPCAYPLQVGSGGSFHAATVTHTPSYHWVRERSARSVPMSSGTSGTRASRSSLSAGTPDSLSDNESNLAGYVRSVRKSSAPVRSTPGGSRPGSRPSSRPASRAGSKPPSRHGSNLSLDSVDDGSPSKIPISRRTPTLRSSTSTPLSGSILARKLTVPNGTPTRPKTPTGLQSPSTPTTRSRTNSMHRASSIPTLSSSSGIPRSRIPVYMGPSDTASNASSGSVSYSFSGARTPSGSTTPVPSSGSRLQRKDSGASDSGQPRRTSRGGVPTPIDQRAPFRS